MPAALSLRERAMLAKLSVSSFGRSKTDKEISRETTQRYEADDSAARVVKKIGTKTDFKKINMAERLILDFHFLNTLKWDDGSNSRVGLLSSSNFMNYMEQMRTRLIPMFQEAVDEFVIGYPQFLENEKIRKGRMFKADDYPGQTTVRDQFNIDIRIDPIPTGQDLRVDIPQEELDLYRAEIEARQQATLMQGVRALYRDLFKPIKKMAETLSDDKKGFHKSLLGNVAEIAEMIPRINDVVQDPMLDNFKKEIETELLRHPVEALKLSNEAREETAAKAADILKRMEGYL